MTRRHLAFTAFLVLLAATSSLRSQSQEIQTTTPIKYLVVLFQENRPFDHYFGTYPVAQNRAGEIPFKAHPNTPSVNGFTEELLFHNPNKYNPMRLGPAQAVQCSQTHDYTREQRAADLGAMDLFVEFNKASGTQGFASCPEQIVMSYFDGNTVTALWNYAQRYAMSDNHFSSNWGSSAVGAINLISGNTHGASVADKPGDTIAGSVIGNPRPLLDICSPQSTTLITISGKNIGDLLNEKGITWGWFNGGFRTPAGTAACTQSHIGSNGQPQADYIPHHEPFQYYPSTANQLHVPPTAAVGQSDEANHQYDLDLDFWPAAESGHLPAVSFIKAPAYLDGHNRYSDPLAEQRFLVETINRLQRLHEWKEMAILIAYDDSDGLYDHVLPPLANASNTTADWRTGEGSCGASTPGSYQGRCGYGPRLPLLAISPYAKTNFVDHTLSDQSSIIRFIEDNWGLPRIGDQSFDEIAGSIMNMFDFSVAKPRHLFLNPDTGQPLEDLKTARPFSGECRTEFAVLTNPPGETDLPPSTQGLVTKGIIRITGTCTLTHLGNSTLEAVQRLEGPPATPPEVVTKLQNIGSYTAANGDILRFAMVGDVRPGDAQWPVQFSGTTVFRGGTGRFVAVSGSARFEGGARFESPITGVGYFSHSEGAISY